MIDAWDVEKMKSFDLISDLHLDIYWGYYFGDCEESGVETPSEEAFFHDFAQAITPEVPSPVLVVAGDLGHDDRHWIMLCQALLEKYKYILFVFGNHDLYLLPDVALHRQFKTSSQRWQCLKEATRKLPGVICLEGTTIEIEGIRFGGTGGWYDYSYGLKLGYEWEYLDAYWRSSFSDGEWIVNSPNPDEEKDKLRSIIHNCDVIVTHVPPDDSQIDERYRNDLTSSYFYFDGTELIGMAKTGAVWCTGHVHRRHMYMRNGILFASHPLGYPDEAPLSKAITIRIESSCYANEAKGVDNDGK